MVSFKNGIVLECDGSGLWRAESGATAEITGLEVPYVNDESSFGELRVFFNAESPTGWDVSKDGLIYTDEGFLEELRFLLVKQGFSVAATKDVDYSEQGMQGEDYVSLDVGRVFLDGWLELFGNFD